MGSNARSLSGRSSPSRSLRIGVVLHGNLVEEKVFAASARSPITIGQRLSCALSIPVEGVPLEHVLFAAHDGRFVLHPTRAMDGRLAQGGGAHGAPVVLEGGTPVVLQAGARGKLMIGDATILFQEIATPAAAPRPHLPASIRGSIFDRVDGRLALLVGGSLALHGALAVWAWVQDTETTVLGKPEVAMTYHPESVEIFLPDDVGPMTPDPGPARPGVARPVSPAQNVTPSNNQHVANQIPDAAKLHDDAIRDAIAMANLLVNPSDRPGGAPGTMDPRRPDSDLNQQIRDLRDTHVEIGTPSRVRDDGKVRIGTTDRVIVDGPPTTIEDVAHRPEDRPVRIVVSPVRPDDTTTLTPDTIMAKIGGLYLTGLQRCYQKGLTRDAELTGKVALRFTVNESGRVVDASASGVSAGVDGCIAGLMGGWTFAVPRDPRSKEPTEASFGLALQLTR